MTSELAVECQSQGCDWKGKYARARAHQKHCPKLLVKCSNEGCAFREARENIPQHKKSCSKREIPCKDCGDLIVWDSLQEHEQFQCINAMCKTVSLRLQGNISQEIMLLILVTLSLSMAGLSKEK